MIIKKRALQILIISLGLSLKIFSNSHYKTLIPFLIDLKNNSLAYDQCIDTYKKQLKSALSEEETIEIEKQLRACILLPTKPYELFFEDNAHHNDFFDYKYKIIEKLSSHPKFQELTSVKKYVILKGIYMILGYYLTNSKIEAMENSEFSEKVLNACTEHLDRYHPRPVINFINTLFTQKNDSEIRELFKTVVSYPNNEPMPIRWIDYFIGSIGSFRDRRQEGQDLFKVVKVCQELQRRNLYADDSEKTFCTNAEELLRQRIDVTRRSWPFNYFDTITPMDELYEDEYGNPFFRKNTTLMARKIDTENLYKHADIMDLATWHLRCSSLNEDDEEKDICKKIGELWQETVKNPDIRSLVNQFTYKQKAG